MRFTDFSARQREELGKFTLDLSKLIIASWVLGLFTGGFESGRMVLLILGLILSAVFLIMGLDLFKGVR